ncbi:ABC-type glycerol-3-phosphate transport system substrate-binding protein [Devosia sp. UYZn731]|uniref:hypothetical protein n=1 Tax=Devosia sp. UYZn731 TaxID=3156345 RepID=UPI0033929EA5
MSASCSHPAEAFAFAHWLAGRAVQAGPYVPAAGQPGHVAAWASEEANAVTGQFFRATRKTLEGAWIRPRHAGFIELQSKAAELVNTALLAKRSGDAVVRQLNDMLGRSIDG